MAINELAEKVSVESSTSDTRAKLSESAFDFAVRDSVQKSEPADKQNTFDNPYFHISLATSAMREMQILAGRNPEDKITVLDSAGKSTEQAVRERRDALNSIAEKEFASAVRAADMVAKNEVEKSLAVIGLRLKESADEAEKTKLNEQYSALSALRHAPSASRFAFAMYFASNSQLDKAAVLMDEAATLDPEAAKDAQFNFFRKQVSDALLMHQTKLVDSSEYMLPLLNLRIANEFRQNGDLASAEKYLIDSISRADKLDKQVIATQLKSLDELLTDNKQNADALQSYGEQKVAWMAVANSPAIARMNYADLLLQEKRYKDAELQLNEVKTRFPEFVKGQKQFTDMLELARSEGKSAPDTNPFAHLEGFQKALEKGDIAAARNELLAAKKAADSIDRELMQHNKKVIQDQLARETNSEKISQLKQVWQIYDAFDHAAAFARVTLGKFELAAKNYNLASDNLKQARSLDPSFTARPEIGFDKLLESSNEPSLFSKVLDFTKNMLKELMADAAAVAAGAGAVVLTGWSGPAAVAAGAVSGAAVYTAVKALMGDEIHWYTPLWGAVDGASGGLGMLARQTLVNVGGKIVSQEVAQAAVLRTGGSLSSLVGLEGVQMADAAKELASSGLKAMGKDIGFWSRIASSVPFVGAGNAEYRAALSAYRALTVTDAAVHAGINLGTAAAMSASYRAAREGYSWYSGEHANFAEFAKAYGTAVLRDSVSGMVMGGFSDGYTDGLVFTVTTNGVKAAFSSPANSMEFFNKWATGSSQDLAFGTVSYLLGMGAHAGGRWINPTIPGNFRNIYSPSVPLWSQAYYTRDYIQSTVTPLVNEMQRVPTVQELVGRYKTYPGPYFSFPTAAVPVA